jgi:very-short-patch-repair endonuclease
MHTIYTDYFWKELHALHLEGLSVKRVGFEYHIQRQTIYNNWKRLGLVWNNRSQAELVKWAQMSEERREAQTRSAHDAARGREMPYEEKVRRAITNEANAKPSKYEAIILENLSKFGFNPKLNMAFGPFNIDLAFEDIKLAVEIDGGGWHQWGEKLEIDFHKEERLKTEGWDLIRLTGKTEHRFRLHSAHLIAYLQGIGPRPPVAMINGVIARDANGRFTNPDFQDIFADLLARQRENAAVSAQVRKNLVTDTNILNRNQPTTSTD